MKIISGRLAKHVNYAINVLRYIEYNNIFTVAFAYSYLLDLVISMETITSPSILSDHREQLIRTAIERVASEDVTGTKPITLMSSLERSELCSSIRKIRNGFAHSPDSLDTCYTNLLDINSKVVLFELFQCIYKEQEKVAVDEVVARKSALFCRV